MEPIRVPLTKEETLAAEKLLEQAGLVIDPDKQIVKDVLIIGGKIKDIEEIEKSALLLEKDRILDLLKKQFGRTFEIMAGAGEKAKKMLTFIHHL